MYFSTRFLLCFFTTVVVIMVPAFFAARTSAPVIAAHTTRGIATGFDGAFFRGSSSKSFSDLTSFLPPTVLAASPGFLQRPASLRVCAACLYVLYRL